MFSSGGSVEAKRPPSKQIRRDYKEVMSLRNSHIVLFSLCRVFFFRKLSVIRFKARHEGQAHMNRFMKL